MALTQKIFKCQKCFYSDSVDVRRAENTIYKYLHQVNCRKCKNQWLVCTIHNMRWDYRHYFRAKNHLKEIDHSSYGNTPCFASNLVSTNITNKNDISTDSVDNDFLNDNNSDSNESEASQYNNDCIDLFKVATRPIDLQGYDKNMRRFIECDHIKAGNGIRRLIACAFAMNQDADYLSISVPEVQFHLKASLFCHTLSASQKTQFWQICNMMSSTFFSSMQNMNKDLVTRPPTSTNDVERFYTSRTTSIGKNIPIPHIEEVDDHAYVSIKECVRHFLCFEQHIDGMLINKVSNNYLNIISASKGVCIAPISDDIRRSVKANIGPLLSPLIIYVILWSDDFEPNNVKQHKKSTWIKTVTFAPPYGFQTSPSHTYVIALGAKNLDHELINHYFQKELKELQVPTYMYCKATQSNIPIVVYPLAISADRPERSSLNSMLGHNGSNTRRWRYSAYVNPLITKACISCMVQRIHALSSNANISINNACTSCCDWNFDHHLMSFPKPKEYPKVQHKNSPPPPIGREVEGVQNLYPIEITYAKLIQGVQYSFFNSYHQTWNQGNTVSYLKALGLTSKFAKENIYNVANQCSKIANFDETTLFDYINYPVLWKSDLLLHQCIDTPMHHLFQGIVKSVMDLTNDWLSSKDGPQYKDFGDHVNDSLLELHDLGIDWCRAEKFMSGRNYSLGGWQAEQFVAFARFSLIVYASIRDVVSDDEVGIDEHECMIQALLCLLCRLMSDDIINSNELTEYVKCFLSAMDTFEYVAYSMNGAPPCWFRKSNFLSLLNLPFQIQRFGNLRYYWEGSRERSIQQIKPFLINMRYTASYYKTKLKQMFIVQTLKQMEENFSLFDSEEEQHIMNPTTYDRYGSFKVYSHTTDLISTIEKKSILSCIVMTSALTGNNIYICQKNVQSSSCRLHTVVFDDDNGFNKCGMWYAPITIIRSKAYTNVRKMEIQSMSTDFGILCPCISKNNAYNNCYAMFTKEWKYRSKFGSISFAALSSNLFLSIFRKRGDNVYE